MKDALVILGMGGPDSAEAIQPFLFNLFSDRQIINFGIGDYPQRLIAKAISKKRAKKITPEYIKMGLNGASPQNVHNKELIKKVAEIYQKRTGKTLDTFEAMCYYKPFIEYTFKNMVEHYNNVHLLPLYPHFSVTTTGVCFNRVSKIINKKPIDCTKLITYPFWYKDKNYNECLKKRIFDASKKLDVPIEKCTILFSAHSIPKSFLDNGDVYIPQIYEHCKLLAEEVKCDAWEVSFQSKVGPVEWVKPATVDALVKLGTLRVNNIIVVPISFLCDHIETLIELDEQLIPNSKNQGQNVVRSESLNSSDDFANAIVSMITSDTDIK